MGGFTTGVLLSFLTISASASSVEVGDSPVTCSSEGVECDRTEDNLLDAVMHVMTLTECRQMCLDEDKCNYITYFDDSASISHLCQMFTTCDTINDCSGCVSENMDCFISPCSSNVFGDLDENVYDLLTNIESHSDCKQSCLNVSACTFYTFFFPNDTLYENYCLLQTEFVGPAQPCSSCVSGPADCDNTTITTTTTPATTTATPCSLSMNGEEYQSLMLTNVSETHGNDTLYITYEISVGGGSGSCNVTFLLVGGGGRQSCGDRCFFGGGGSGYLEYNSIQVSPGTNITARVGDQRQASNLTIGNITFTAQPGQDSHPSWDGEDDDGGNGYSGGGGSGADGGMNGGDGGDGVRGDGGRGTGEDIRLYTFATWTLSPGAGGKHGDSIYYWGGGGGGVLVDRQGPDAEESQGQGYGGGGAWAHGAFDGLQGVILIEINRFD